MGLVHLFRITGVAVDILMIRGTGLHSVIYLAVLCLVVACDSQGHDGILRQIIFNTLAGEDFLQCVIIIHECDMKSPGQIFPVFVIAVH